MAFCRYCGKEIPDGTECSCRTETSNSNGELTLSPEENGTVYDASQSTYDAPQSTYDASQSTYGYGMPSMPQGPGSEIYSNYYSPQQPQYGGGQYGGGSGNTAGISSEHRIIKEVFGSPLALVTAILFSLQFLVGFSGGFNFNITLILTIVGFWLLYAFSRKKDAPLKPVGFKLHSIALTIERILLILLYVIVALVLVIMAIIPKYLNEALEEISEYFPADFELDKIMTLTSAVFIIALVVFTCVVAFSLVNNIILKKNVASLKDKITDSDSGRKLNIFPAVVFFINAVSSLGSAIALIATVKIRRTFLAKFWEGLVDFLENETGDTLDLPFRYSENYGQIIGYLVSAAASVMAALLVIKLCNKLKNQDSAQ